MEESSELIAAIKGGDIERVQILLDAGAPVDARDGEQRTPLMWAARDGKLEIVKLLISRDKELVASSCERSTTCMTKLKQNDSKGEMEYS